MTKHGLSMRERFEQYVMPEPNSGCHLWTGAVNGDGYGTMRVGSNPSAKAHRLAYEIFRGTVPDGMAVCHKCDVPSCVNPDHLFLGTWQVNTIDAVRKKRWCGQRLGPDDIPTIRKRLSTGEYASAIARDYGVHEQTIYSLKSGKSWAHVP